MEIKHTILFRHSENNAYFCMAIEKKEINE